MALGIDPKVDFAFKWLFGNERNKPLLTHLLNAVLSLPPGEQIAEVEILNPFNEKEALDDKLSILDVKARDQLGRLYNVEMQMLAYRQLPPRLLYYWATLHGSQMHEGEDYGLLRPTFTVCFLDDVLFPTTPEHHLTFRLLDDRHQLAFCDDLRIDLIELPKFTKPPAELTDSLDAWAYFLRHAAQMEFGEFPTAVRATEISEALEALAMLAQTDRQRELYESRLKALRDRNAQMQEMERRGLQQGLQQGLSRGRVQGELLGRIETYQELLAMESPSRSDLEAMAEEDLRVLNEQLQQQVAQALGRG